MKTSMFYRHLYLRWIKTVYGSLMVLGVMPIVNQHLMATPKSMTDNSRSNALRITAIGDSTATQVRIFLEARLADIGLAIMPVEAVRAIRGSGETREEGIEFSFRLQDTKTGNQDWAFSGFLTQGGELSLQDEPGGEKILVVRYGDQTIDVNEKYSFPNIDLFVRRASDKGHLVITHFAHNPEGSAKMFAAKISAGKFSVIEDALSGTDLERQSRFVLEINPGARNRIFSGGEPEDQKTIGQYFERYGAYFKLPM